tara:strand:- start:6122 stop:7204 length:1083 start_codon:yes stop_codon:yes gene_type:complete
MMGHYILKRLALMIPTLLGIMLVNFLIVQAAPGGPVEQMMAQIQAHDVNATSRVSGGLADVAAAGTQSNYRGSQGLEQELIERLEKQFGFDKPAHERFFSMLWNYLRFDFGDSFYRDQSVISIIIEKLPVSISLGLWSTLLMYLIAIPLGIKKAIRDGSSFDVWTSMVVIVGNAIPAFLFAILFIVLFAGGTYFDWFPLRGLVSDNWDELTWGAKIVDYFWHITLPVVCLVIGSFAGLTLLTKNSFLDEIGKQYVLTAKAKGLNDTQVLYRHVFRNAMLIVIAGIPGQLVGILFTGSMLIEIVFSLDGLGLLGYESVVNRDYPVVFGTLYIFTLIGLLLNLIGDMTYVLVDPRIDFEGRS